MSGGKEYRLEVFRDLLADAHRALDLAFGFELWDGSTVPGDLPPYAMRIVFGSESVVAASSAARPPTRSSTPMWRA